MMLTEGNLGHISYFGPAQPWRVGEGLGGGSAPPQGHMTPAVFGVPGRGRGRAGRWHLQSRRRALRADM